MSWPKRSCMLCNIRPSYETGGGGFAKLPLLADWLGISLLVGGGECLSITYFFFFTLFSFIALWNCPYLDPGLFLAFTFSIVPPIPPQRETGRMFSGWPGSTHHLQKRSKERMRRKWDASYWTNCFAMALFFNAVGGNNQIPIVRVWVEEVTVHFLFPICWCQEEGSMDLKEINKLITVPVVWTNWTKCAASSNL